MRFALVPAALAVAIGAPSYGQFYITEIRTGSDPTEYVEIAGTPGASLDGVTFLIIGDGTSTGATPTRTGVVEWKWTFGPSDVIGANGYLVLRNSAMSALSVAAGATDVPWPPAVPATDPSGFEGSDNMTFLLVSGYSGTDTFVGRAPNQGQGGQDLDLDDDGTLDVTPWTGIIDSVAIKLQTGATPNAGEDWWYSSNTAGPYISRSVVHATTGTVVAGWDFQTTSNGGTAAVASPNTPKVFTANVGAGTLFLDGTNGASDWIAASELNSFTGSNLNASGYGLSTVTSGTACLALVNQSANSKSLVIKFSMTGIVGLNVSYATQRTGTGFNDQQWSISSNGTDWTDIDDITSIPASFSVRTLSPISALDNSADAYLRLKVAGASSASGNNRLDNIVLLSNPVSQDTVVTNYGAPVHAFKTAGGSWAMGQGATTGGFDTPGAANATVPFLICGSGDAGACDAAHFYPYCSDSCCCGYVCANDPYCCTTHWDGICATKALDCATECAKQPCPADLNLDGQVDGADLGALLGAWGTRANDLNGDGNVDGADLGILLGAWGLCP